MMTRVAQFYKLHNFTSCTILQVAQFYKTCEFSSNGYQVQDDDKGSVEVGDVALAAAPGAGHGVLRKGQNGAN
jgi:hypothetical protein